MNTILTTTLTNKVFVEKKFLEEIQEKEIKIELVCILQSLINLGKQFNNRFIAMEQDVFLDTQSGLLFPDFSKNEFLYITLNAFCEYLKGYKKGKIVNDSLKKALKVYNFEGRLLNGFELDIFKDKNFPCKSTIHYWDLSSHSGIKKIQYVYDDSVKSRGKVFSFNCFSREKSYYEFRGGTSYGIVVPVYDFFKFKKKYPFSISELFSFVKLLIEKGLTPKDIPDFDKIKKLIEKYKESIVVKGNQIVLKKVDEKRESSDLNVQKSISLQTSVTEFLLTCDEKRANLSPYTENLLTDLNAGHWELFEQQSKQFDEKWCEVELQKKLVARPPEMDIKESGICAIDFGTSSTVVVCRNRGERMLRIGTGDYSKAPVLSDYENPTVIELRDIISFIDAYNNRIGRPFTKWEQMTVSHQARERLFQDKTAQSFKKVFSELKQWAYDSSERYHLCDDKGFELTLNAFNKLEDNDFNPIEYYAYYLGLYINNMFNGIYMEYILSFPVKYPKEIRDRILDSFSKGLKKSLPPSILTNKELMETFSIYYGASEPAAYAACALKELGKVNKNLIPSKNKPIHFAVFDFGGGTTDFDYGIWRLPTPTDKGRWNYIIEHFHAEGDVNLGGEKLLQLIAYRVYKDNIQIMREKQVPFVLPPEETPFEGSELLLDCSDEAYMNLNRLSNALRPIWEDPKGEKAKEIANEEYNILLFTRNGLSNFSLRVNVEALQNELKKRIRRGIDSFFIGMWHAFDKNIGNGTSAVKINILLAGNSCKSELVQAVFKEAIEEEISKIKTTVNKIGKNLFNLHMPLEYSKTDNSKFEQTPTGKTGVAFGLLDCRRGGSDVKVIDRNLDKKQEAPFIYFLGLNGRTDNFEVVIAKDVGYDQWCFFREIESFENHFELYYTSEANALDNNMSLYDINEPKRCRVRFNNRKDGMIFIKKIAPKIIEYTVAESEEDLRNGKTIAEISTCVLG